MSMCQRKQALLGKEGIGPAMVILATRAASLATALA